MKSRLRRQRRLELHCGCRRIRHHARDSYEFLTVVDGGAGVVEIVTTNPTGTAWAVFPMSLMPYWGEAARWSAAGAPCDGKGSVGFVRDGSNVPRE